MPEISQGVGDFQYWSDVIVPWCWSGFLEEWIRWMFFSKKKMTSAMGNLDEGNIFPSKK